MDMGISSDVISAGFFDTATGICSGYSESLKINSRPTEDANIINGHGATDSSLF